MLHNIRLTAGRELFDRGDKSVMKRLLCGVCRSVGAWVTGSVFWARMQTKQAAVIAPHNPSGRLL